MQVFHPFSDIDQSNAIYLVVRVETDAVIINDQFYISVIGFEGHNHGFRSAVLYDIPELFLKDTVKIDFLMVGNKFFINMVDTEYNIYFMDCFNVFNESFYTFEQGIFL